MRNFVQPGDTISVTAPYAVASGGGALVGSIFGIATNAAANAAPVELKRTGVFDVAKATGETWTQGAKVYWNNSTKVLTTTSAGNTLVGVAARAQGSGDTTGRALLTGQIV